MDKLLTEAVLTAAQWLALERTASLLGVTPTALVVSVFAEILQQSSYLPHLAINLTVFNRLPLHEDVASLIGDFTLTLPLECRAAVSEVFAGRSIFGSFAIDRILGTVELLGW